MPHSVLSTHNAPLHGWSVLFWGAKMLGGDNAAGGGVKVCTGRAVEACSLLHCSPSSRSLMKRRTPSSPQGDTNQGDT